MNQNNINRSRGTLLFVLVLILSSIGVSQPKTVYAQLGTAPGGHKVYLPVLSSASTNDLAITRIEVTQAVQDGNNSVPLIAGRATMLRIYTQDVGYSQAPINVKVSVSAASANSALSVSPQAFLTTIPLNSSQSNIQSTVNYKLPANWTSGVVDITVKLDVDNMIGEFNEGNNSFNLHLVFNTVPPLKIVIVPIQYTNTTDGYTYPAPKTDTISDWIMRTYPVSQIQVSFHAPYSFTGNLSTSAGFNTLLNSITDLKVTEKSASSINYYGLIPTADGSKRWFNGGIAGIGWIGSRTAIGLDLAGNSAQIAAHEIGHNLGMWHTPCGNASGPDPKYPYPDGSIGQYGLDLTSNTVYVPGSKDVMSYCDPKWISDYTYKVLFNNQTQYGAATMQPLIAQDPSIGLSTRKLLVRANIKQDGVDLFPVYILPGASEGAPEAGDYQVQVLGLHGETLVQMPVKGYEAVEEGVSQFTGINALIPLPDQPAAKMRLLKDGQVLAEQALQVQAVSLNKAAAATVESAGNGYQVRWAASPQPVMVRYSADSGKTWTILGMDVTNSELNVLSASLPTKAGTFEVIPAGMWK